MDKILYIRVNSLCFHFMTDKVVTQISLETADSLRMKNFARPYRCYWGPPYLITLTSPPNGNNENLKMTV